MKRELLEITRWRGFSHAELYQLLHSGPGATASAEPSRRWAGLATTLTDVNQDLGQAITRAKSSWAGEAANRAFTQLSEVADWAGPAGESAARMRAAVEQQGDHIGRARAAMPAPGEEPTPKPDPLITPVLQLLHMGGDHEPIERATSEAARRAFEVMSLYQDDTTATTDGLPQFAEPAETGGVHHGRNRGRGPGIDDTPQQTSLSSLSSSGTGSAAAPPEQGQYHRSDDLRPRGQSVGQAQAGGFMIEPEVETRRPVAPLQQGAVTGTAPIAAPTTRSTERQSQSRNSFGSARGVLPLSSLDMNDLPAAAGTPSLMAPSVTPAGAGASTAGDRTMLRRVGEPLIPGQWMNDAVEPAARTTRRGDQPDDEITESVDGAEEQVPPSVIGSEPYRQ